MATDTYAYTNEAGFESRLSFVQGVFENTLHLKPLEIKPIAYEEGFPFPYNNFVYVVSIDREKSQPDHRLHASQPGTQKCPADLATFILRLPNPVSGYNDEVRVENEVAALSVARDALEKKHPGVVPRVFTWQSAKDNQGWMLQEHMPGEPLLEDFQKMSHQEQADILEQMADILACFQRHQLPESIKGYGGLSFDSAGNYISAPMGIMKGGPFPTYDVLVRETIQSKLAKADTDDQVDGWRDHGIRGRLDKFVKQGVQSVMSKGINDLPRVLVHADFSTDNLLYDKTTHRITAILDFDFSYVASVADEFFRSLGHGIGCFPDARDGNADLVALHHAMLIDFSDELPSSDGEVQWQAAKAWNDALCKREIYRPSTIPNIAELADLFWLYSQILPFKLCNPVVVENSSAEQLRQRKEEGEKALIKFLEDHGF